MWLHGQFLSLELKEGEIMVEVGWQGGVYTAEKAIKVDQTFLQIGGFIYVFYMTHWHVFVFLKIIEKAS